MRVDLAFFLAVQACRYPERYRSGLKVGKWLTIALEEGRSNSDAPAFNSWLARSGLLPGVALNEAEFDLLAKAPNEDVPGAVEQILLAHGYESFFNLSLVIAAALPIAEHLLGLEWQLIEIRGAVVYPL